ncbi:unnamed protein product [Arctogadus glacialis]
MMPRRCSSLMEAQTSTTMPTVCNPSVSHTAPGAIPPPRPPAAAATAAAAGARPGLLRPRRRLPTPVARLLRLHDDEDDAPSSAPGPSTCRRGSRPRPSSSLSPGGPGGEGGHPARGAEGGGSRSQGQPPEEEVEGVEEEEEVEEVEEEEEVVEEVEEEVEEGEPCGTQRSEVPDESSGQAETVFQRELTRAAKAGEATLGQREGAETDRRNASLAS